MIKCSGFREKEIFTWKCEFGEEYEGCVWNWNHDYLMIVGKLRKDEMDDCDEEPYVEPYKPPYVQPTEPTPDPATDPPTDPTPTPTPAPTPTPNPP